MMSTPRLWYTALGFAFFLPGATLTSQQATVADTRATPSLAEAEAVLARPVTVNVERSSLRNAIDVIGAAAQIRVQYRASLLERYATLVTLHVAHMPLGRVLGQALRGTELQVVSLSGGIVAIAALNSTPLGAREGTITGVVRDAKSGQSIRGAKVGLDGRDRVTETDDSGRYHIAGVSAGSHTVMVKLIGYSKAVRTVIVPDGAVVVAEVALEPAAMALDQVVVTGTVVQTELRAVPNAMTVITAKQIEERGITKIDQLFRGDVPGVFAANRGSNPSTLLDETTMYSRGATAVSGLSAGVFKEPLGNTDFYTNPMKTYVDGVEMADPKYLNQIDPRSIERIEILTGPQASTIYGSNAINGVMQIFTKRGTTSRPQLTLNLLSGWVENNFRSSRTPQHDYSAQLNGIEGRFSYNAGGSWNYVGPWTPDKQTTRVDAFGGGRIEFPTSLGKITADMTFRRSSTQNINRGAATQTPTGYQETGWWVRTISITNNVVSVPSRSGVMGQTLGVTLDYTPTNWWSHEFGMGNDASDVEQRSMARGYRNETDTTLSFEQDHTDRRSFRYTTTTQVPMTAFARATLTLGADGWQNLASSWLAASQSLTGTLANVYAATRQPSHNTGGFLQTQLGVADRLFLTYGLRGEWNPNYGKDAEPNYAPRYGAAYTQDVSTPLGPMTTKLRVSYGRTTRPPATGLKAAVTQADNFGSLRWPGLADLFLPYYGTFDYILPNPELAPEQQQGGEGGLELYFGTRGSLVVTRYNQKLDGLISQVLVDSLRSSVLCIPGICGYNSLDADGYGYEWQYRYLNVASIRNQGWELQGSLNAGPFTTKGTYSWTKSRTIGVNPKYRGYFNPSSYPQYQPGATFQYFPEHTWAIGMTYAQSQTTVALSMTGNGRVTKAVNDFYLQYLTPAVRLTPNRQNVSSITRYASAGRAYTLTDLNASHRLSSRIESVLQVQNLWNFYRNDYRADYASLGRQAKLGFRIRTS